MRQALSFKDLVLLEVPETVAVSHDGARVAALVRTTNLATNRYERHCFVYDADGRAEFCLNAPGITIEQVEWLADGRLAALRQPPQGKAQIWIYPTLGEGFPITEEPAGVRAFALFGEGVVYIAATRRERDDYAGSFTHIEQESSRQRLCFVTIDAAQQYFRDKIHDRAPDSPLVNLSGELGLEKHIDAVVCAANAFYIVCRERADLVYRETFNYRVTRSRNGWRSRLLRLPAQARIVDAQKDELLVSAALPEPNSFSISHIWRVRANRLSRGKFETIAENLTFEIDRDCNAKFFGDDVLATYVDGTASRMKLFGRRRVNLGTLRPTAFDAAGGTIACIGFEKHGTWEVFSLRGGKRRRLSNFATQFEKMDLGKVETIRWQSRDGTTIEGVLHKPSNFKRNKRYPLLFVVHGGPRAANLDARLEARDITCYPVASFLEKDILVLKPNYRGSAGRGQAFTELNVDNLGVGDLWDLESAVDHLDAQGMIDTDRVGCAGWSQGGYISAFAGNRSRYFRAVSVGAGISDWYTYHISNDVPHFTTDYLSGSPFDDRTRYDKTSAVAGLSEKSAPHLIQHGEKDRRVPVSNAWELYRGLQAKSVPVELFIYSGFGHAIDRPRENCSLMHQNFNWFCHHLLGEALNLEPPAPQQD